MNPLTPVWPTAAPRARRLLLLLLGVVICAAVAGQPSPWFDVNSFCCHGPFDAADGMGAFFFATPASGGPSHLNILQAAFGLGWGVSGPVSHTFSVALMAATGSPLQPSGGVLASATGLSATITDDYGWTYFNVFTYDGQQSAPTTARALTLQGGPTF